MLSIPPLMDEPSKYYGSCTFISTSLISVLSDLLPSKPDLILSVGGGLGLIEAFLIQTGSHMIESVEVPAFHEERKYLQETSMHYVRGTWDICDRARDATAWLFFFPRDPGLLTKYLERYKHDRLSAILWVGPSGDAPAMRTAVNDPDFHVAHTGLETCIHAGEASLLWRRVSNVEPQAEPGGNT